MLGFLLVKFIIFIEENLEEIWIFTLLAAFSYLILNAT